MKLVDQTGMAVKLVRMFAHLNTEPYGQNSDLYRQADGEDTEPPLEEDNRRCASLRSPFA